MAQFGTLKLDSAVTSSSKLGENPSYLTTGLSFAEAGSDTTAVWMLVGLKANHGHGVQLIQHKGYSIMPRFIINALPKASYLDFKKEPVSDRYTVWMSVPRQEDCEYK